MTRLASILVLAVLVATPACAGEPPPCTGRNLLEELAATDRQAYAAVMAEAKATPNGNAVFWKVEKDGVKPSYLLGTAHVSDPRVTNPPPGVEAAIEAADIVALELAELGDDQEMARAAAQNAALMLMPDGQSLWDIIPDADEAFIRDNENLPEGAGGALAGFQPWVVAAMLSLPACERQRQNSGLRKFDDLIARFANRKDVGVRGLETVEEQFRAMSGMPLADQAASLVATARLGGTIRDHFVTLMDLYEDRQVGAYLPLLKRIAPGVAGDSRTEAYWDEVFIRQRNHRMAERAADLLAKGNAFIAVGALHLPGAEGLVELIRKAGYKVTPAN